MCCFLFLGRYLDVNWGGWVDIKPVFFWGDGFLMGVGGS